MVILWTTWKHKVAKGSVSIHVAMAQYLPNPLVKKFKMKTGQNHVYGYWVRFFHLPQQPKNDVTCCHTPTMPHILLSSSPRKIREANRMWTEPCEERDVNEPWPSDERE